MSLAYPVNCSVGGCASVTLVDAPTLATHHTAAHATIPIADYQQQLAKGKAPVPGAPPRADQAPLETAFARFGLTETRFRSVKEHETTSGGFYGPADIAAMGTHLADVLGYQVHMERLVLDLLILILEHRGTEDVESLGGFELYANDESQHQFWSWEKFKTQVGPFFKNRGQKFTFRRFIPGLEPVFWQLWIDPGVEALRPLREEGTPASREWRLTDGGAVEPYVIVPGLFNSHLTEAEWEIRRLSRSAVNLDKEKGSMQVYSGISNAREVDEAADMERAAKLAAKRARLIQAAGATGSQAASWARRMDEQSKLNELKL